MIYNYEREEKQISFDSIVDDVLGLSGNLNEEIVDNMVEYLLEYYGFDECLIDYNADIWQEREGGYYPCDGSIEIAISALERPIGAFETLTHEMAHKYDDENNINAGRVDNKGPLYLARTGFPQLVGPLISKSILSKPLSAYMSFYYYTHPQEIFARKEALKMMTLLLEECKKKYQTIEDGSRQSIAKARIKELRQIIKWCKRNERQYALSKIYGPLCKPLAKIVYNQMGKKLHRQIKKNLIDQELSEDLESWIKTFGIDNFHSKSSYLRLTEIVEMTKEYQDLNYKINALLQNLGIVEYSKQAIEQNMFNMMKCWDAERRQQEIEDSYWTELYMAYDRKYIQTIEKHVLKQLALWDNDLKNHQAEEFLPKSMTANEKSQKIGQFNLEAERKSIKNKQEMEM